MNNILYTTTDMTTITLNTNNNNHNNINMEEEIKKTLGYDLEEIKRLIEEKNKKAEIRRNTQKEYYYRHKDEKEFQERQVISHQKYYQNNKEKVKEKKQIIYGKQRREK